MIQGDRAQENHYSLNSVQGVIYIYIHICIRDSIGECSRAYQGGLD